MAPTIERETSTASKRKVGEMLSLAGIEVGGEHPWDPRIHDPGFYDRVLAHGNLGAGESYMDGGWDVDRLDEFFARIHQSDPYRRAGGIDTLLLSFIARLFNRQQRQRAGAVANVHYNLGNDLYEAMLGPSMQYTCAYWAGARDLDQAQEDKLDLICRKLHLKAGMRVLDLGGGFGGLAHFMASRYGCRVVSYNISREQVEYARRWCRDLPVRVELRDYRDAAREAKRFERVTAVGLCEHIGYKNYGAFFRLAHGCLADQGLFLLHTIGGNEPATATDPWIDKYIFPNGMVPSMSQLAEAFEGLWIVEDWHNFGPDYDLTLRAWSGNFERAWPRLRERYGERFRRMWRYYLLASAGTFRARKLQLWQVVLSKGDIGRYQPVR